jgi:hypothetical protein
LDAVVEGGFVDVEEVGDGELVGFDRVAGVAEGDEGLGGGAVICDIVAGFVVDRPDDGTVRARTAVRRC